LRLYAYEVIWPLDLMLFRLETRGFEPAPDAGPDAVQDPGNDPPNVRALRLRTWLDLGQHGFARRLLREFVDLDLRELPRDRDYLGTLAHLAAAASVLDERAAAELLYALLAPYAAWFATDVSLHSRGSIAHWLGVLARTLGKSAEAAAHFEYAVARNEAMQFAPRTAESRYELARTLAASGEPTDFERARALCEQALASARAIGMQPLARKLEQLQAELGA
jgi:hypothetical protein